MSQWINVKDQLPEDSLDKFYVVGRLTQEHMWTTHRTCPYDVISGRYLNRFPNLYTHWMLVPEEAE